MSSRPEIDEFQQRLKQLRPTDTAYASEFVDLLLDAARTVRASDVHLQPAADGLDVRWRLDGVLQSLGNFPRGEAADIVSRLLLQVVKQPVVADRQRERHLRHVKKVAGIPVVEFRRSQHFHLTPLQKTRFPG